MSGVRYSLVALALAWLAASSSAVAQATTADRGAEYHRVIEEALQEFNIGNWEEAAVLFERAHGINPSARTERGMGMAAFEARHYVSAIAHFGAALGERRNPLTTTQREEVQRSLGRAHDYVARLAVDVQPRDARVRINGHLVEPDTHGDRLADPGMQEVEIAADGFEPMVRRVHVGSGKREVLVARLRELSNTAVLPSGPSAATQASSTDTWQRDGSALSTWKWLLGASGLVGLAAGGAFLIVQKAEADRYNGMCDPDKLTETCASIEKNAGGLWYVGSIVGLGLGAGLLSASAVLFMLDSARPNPERARQNGCSLGFADLGVTCKLTL